MRTWKDFSRLEPEMAETGIRLIFQFGVGLAFIATLRKDGAPRLHPVCPILSDGSLFILVMPGSPKRWDLSRDGRFSMQSFPEARPDSDEFYLSGVARRIEDSVLIQSVFQDAQHAAAENEILFEILVDRVMHTQWEGFGGDDYRAVHRIWKDNVVSEEKEPDIDNGRWLIRKALPSDVGTIAALTDAAYSGYIPLIGRKPQPMTADYRSMVNEHPIWLFCENEKPIGVLVLHKEPDSMLIYSIAVSPEHQNQGIGSQLMAWAEEQSRISGYHTLRLYTNEHFQRNIQIYKHLGYLETGREPLMGSMIVHMAKRLS